MRPPLPRICTVAFNVNFRSLCSPGCQWHRPIQEVRPCDSVAVQRNCRFKCSTFMCRPLVGPDSSIVIYVPTRILEREWKSPKTFMIHRTTAITTTPFKIDLIDPCMGIKRFTNHSRTPTTMRFLLLLAIEAKAWERTSLGAWLTLLMVTRSQLNYLERLEIRSKSWPT